MPQTTNTLTDVPGQDTETRSEARKPYSNPRVIIELELEARAGSPLGFPDPMDPLGLGLPGPEEPRK